MKNRYWFIPYVFILILIAVTVGQCQSLRAVKQEIRNTTDFFNDSIKFYKNKLGQEVSYKGVLQGEKETLELLLSNQIDSTNQLKGLVLRYKKTLAAANINTKIQIDTIEIPYEIPVPFDFERDFRIEKEFYTISGISSSVGLTIDEVSLVNTQSLVIGQTKAKLFKPSKLEISMVNSNPHIKTTGLDTYIHTVKPKRFGVSLYFGPGIGQDLRLSTQIGIGLTYNLIQF